MLASSAFAAEPTLKHMTIKQERESIAPAPSGRHVSKYTASGKSKYIGAQDAARMEKDAEDSQSLDRVWNKYKDLAAGKETEEPEEKPTSTESQTKPTAKKASAIAKPKKPYRTTVKKLSPPAQERPVLTPESIKEKAAIPPSAARADALPVLGEDALPKTETAGPPVPAPTETKTPLAALVEKIQTRNKPQPLRTLTISTPEAPSAKEKTQP